MQNHTSRDKSAALQGGTNACTPPSLRQSVASVKDLARDQWLGILAALGGIDARLHDGRHHVRPDCGGRGWSGFFDKAGDPGSSPLREHAARHFGDRVDLFTAISIAFGRTSSWGAEKLATGVAP